MTPAGAFLLGLCFGVLLLLGLVVAAPMFVQWRQRRHMLDMLHAAAKAMQAGHGRLMVLPDAAEVTPLKHGTGDDPVYCGLCGAAKSVATIAHHLVTEHGVDPADIAGADIRDET